MCLNLPRSRVVSSQSVDCPLPPSPAQHCSVSMLKEMLLCLDLARLVGTAADRRAADRLQRRLLHVDDKESGLLVVRRRRNACMLCHTFVLSVLLFGGGAVPVVLKRGRQGGDAAGGACERGEEDACVWCVRACMRWVVV